MGPGHGNEGSQRQFLDDLLGLTCGNYLFQWQILMAADIAADIDRCRHNFVV
jgi:hypothetical protein